LPSTECKLSTLNTILGVNPFVAVLADELNYGFKTGVFK